MESKQGVWANVVKEQVTKTMGNAENEMKLFQKTITETREQAAELADREQRKNNIILYNASELNSNNADERYNADLEYCCELFNLLGADCRKEDIKRILRLGKKQEDHNRERPLLLEFRSRMDKNLVMESLSKLKRTGSKFAKVVVVHDMTVKERAQCKSLVEEAKRLEEQGAGEYIYRVRGNPDSLKIVKIRRRQ